MAYTLKDFVNDFPDEVGNNPTINAWITSSLAGKWAIQGMTISRSYPGSNFDNLLENLDKIYFQFYGSNEFFVSTEGSKVLVCGTGASVYLYGKHVNFQENDRFYADAELTEGFSGALDYFSDGTHIVRLNDTGFVVERYLCSDTSTDLGPYPTTGSIFYTGEINTRKKLTNHFYFSFVDDIIVPNDLIGLSSGSAILDVFFEPGFLENFYDSEYNVLVNNSESPRTSKFLLRVDRDTGTLSPNNLEFITGSQVDDLRYSFDTEVFANIQDSSYSSKAWSVPRYEGSSIDNSGIEGNEPAVSLTPFNGAVYEVSSTSSAILSELRSERNLERLYLLEEKGDLAFQGRLGGNFAQLEFSQSGLFTTNYELKHYTGSGEIPSPNNLSVDITASLEFSVVNDRTSYKETRSVFIPVGETGSTLSSYVRQATYYNTELNDYITEYRNFSRIISTTPTNLRTTSTIPSANTAIEGRNYVVRDMLENSNVAKLTDKKVFNIDSEELYILDSEGRIVLIES